MQNTKKLIASTLAALTIFASAAAPAVSDNPLLAKLSIVSTLDASAVSSNNYAVTTPSGLNIRKGADTSFKSIGTIPFAANFTVISKTRKPDGNYWGKITYGGKTGWICLTNYTKPCNYKVTANSGLAFRSGAGTNFSNYYYLSKGTQIYVRSTARKADGTIWGNVLHGGHSGWVCMTYTAKI